MNELHEVVVEKLWYPKKGTTCKLCVLKIKHFWMPHWLKKKSSLIFFINYKEFDRENIWKIKVNCIKKNFFYNMMNATKHVTLVSYQKNSVHFIIGKFEILMVKTWKLAPQRTLTLKWMLNHECIICLPASSFSHILLDLTKNYTEYFLFIFYFLFCVCVCVHVCMLCFA